MAGLVCLLGQESQAPRNPDPSVAMVAPGVFRIGSATLHRGERTVSFPAVLNTNAGPMEYLLVHGKGKVHESILKTDTEPYHIHVAMLLLGAMAVTNNPVGEGSGPIENPSAAKLEGDRISVQVSWVNEGKSNTVAAEKLVWNSASKGSPDKLEWICNGSRLVDGRYIAQIEGSIVSLITDPGAIVNHASPGRDNDQIWAANTNSLPSAQTPLQVTLKLLRPE